MNLTLPQPDPSAVFRMLYKHAAADGREQILFGNNREKLFETFDKMPLGAHFPNIYLEFPLKGEPFCDLICMFHTLPEVSSLKPGQGFGLDRTLAWRRTMQNPKGFFCLEADVSHPGDVPVAPVWDMRFAPKEAGAFLETLDAGDRLHGFHSFMSSIPDSWKPFYLGLYPGRPGAPLRIGLLLSPGEKAAVHENPDVLKRHLTQVGFTPFHDDMLQALSFMIRQELMVEIQFDLYPDGRLGNALGTIATIFNAASPFSPEDYMKTDKAALYMTELEETERIDDRWRLLHDCRLARKIPMVFEDGNETFFDLFVMAHSVKIKYKDGVPSSKCYLSMGAGYIK